MTDLIKRLRGTYTIPVNDGAGPLLGKDTFTRTFESSPIMHEAADALATAEERIRRLEEALTVAKTATIWAMHDDNIPSALRAELQSAHDAISSVLAQPKGEPT